MSEWRESMLGEVANFVTGKLNSNAAEIDGDYPFFTCSPETFRINTYAFDCEALLLAGNNANGVYPLKYYSGKFNAYQRTYVITVQDAKETDIQFLYYLLNLKLNYFKGVSQGSATRFLTMGILNTLDILLPDIAEQRRIAAVLSTLDAKIDLLRRQNHTLEQIAQTLFNRWFVEFEFPTSVNSEKRIVNSGAVDSEKLKVNSEEQLITDHYSLFTGYKSGGGPMQPSELGEIPLGWRVGSLGEVAKNIRLTVNPNDIVSDTPYIGLEHMPRRKIALDTWGLAENIESSKFWFKKGQILFGKLRPYFHKVGVAFTDGICSTDILVLSPKKQAFFGFVLMTVSSVEFVKYVSSASEGTRMPRTNWQYMSDYIVAIPDQNTSQKFSDLISSFVNKMEVNTAQIQTLTRLRDTLLPKLMSGQLRVNSE